MQLNCHFMLMGGFMRLKKFSYEKNIETYDISYNTKLILQRNQALWRAVILQAILDATSTAKRSENVVEKQKALNWIFDRNTDFDTICFLAGYSTGYVQRKAKQFITNNHNVIKKQAYKKKCSKHFKVNNI